MILIAVPTYENISPETFRAIYRLKGDVDFDYVTGYDCAKARNEIARKALNGGFEYVLMVDSDIIIPDNALEYMLDTPVDICFGVYPRKNNPNETELFHDGTLNFEKRYKYTELTAPRVNVKGSGFGCALINTNVFREMDYPWFRFVSYETGAYLSEDLYFCMMAEGRYTMQADTRVRCKHIKRYIVGD